MKMLGRVLVLACVVMTALPGGARGARNAGGALVLHSGDMIFQFRHNYCLEFPLPATCQDLDTQVDLDPMLPDVIWVIAAFPAESSPGVSGLQFGIYGDIPMDYYWDGSPCPQSLENPDPTWPSPGTGTQMTFLAPVYDHFFKVYWFGVVGLNLGATLSTGPYPHGSMQAQFADDSDPPQTDDILKFGTVRWGAPGENYCPDSPPPAGACCYIDGTCVISNFADCETSGGQYQGTGTVCDPNPCSPAGACCLPDLTCQILFQLDCLAQSGTFYPGEPCDPYPCREACCFPDGLCTFESAEQCASAGGTPMGHGTDCDQVVCVGACCLPDLTCQVILESECLAAGGTFHFDLACDPFPCPEACCFQDGSCRDLTETDCAAAGGISDGAGTSCDPNPCHPSPTRPATWGRIKAGYR